LEKALALEADFMATGHYARIRRAENGQIELLQAIDQTKDQSYVLHVLNQAKLSQALFPLGEFTKSQVRQMARDFNLPVAERADSQDLCFLGKGDYRSFLLRNAPQVAVPGQILDRAGKVLGEHQGLAFYTIGQRKGLGIASPSPYYVLEKDRQRNALIVGKQEELGQSELFAFPVNWIAGQPPEASFQAEVKIRYKARPACGFVTHLSDQKVHIQFNEPLRDITPGQAAVIYDREICLGGGVITNPDP
jgi:tRNA-specific 2-thiouridylase